MHCLSVWSDKKVLCEKREMPQVKKHSCTVEEENVFAFVEQEEN